MATIAYRLNQLAIAFRRSRMSRLLTTASLLKEAADEIVRLENLVLYVQEQRSKAEQLVHDLEEFKNSIDVILEHKHR